MRVTPINTEQSPIKVALGQNILSSPRAATVVPVNDQFAYSTVRPAIMQSTGYGQQIYTVPNQQFIRTTALEPTRVQQFSTIQPYYQHQPSVVYTTRPPLQNTQFINTQTIQQSRSFLPPPQQKVVEEIRVSRPVVELEPEVETVIQYEYQEQPKVELGQKSAWDSYYSRQKVYAAPPAPVQAVAEEKTCCNPILIGILGLLALAGLITGIVLAAKAGTGFGNITPNTQTPGQPVKNETFVPPNSTTTTTTTNTSINTAGNKTNSTTVQPTILNPIVVAPNITAPVVTNSTVVSDNKITVLPNVTVAEALPSTSTNTVTTPSTSTTTINSTSVSSPTNTSSTSPNTTSTTKSTNTTTTTTTPTSTVTTTNITNTSTTPTITNNTSTGAKTTNTTSTTSTTTTTTTTSTTPKTTTNTTISKTPIITKPIADPDLQPAHKLFLSNHAKQQHKLRTSRV